MKMMILFGTRPEAIKMAPIIHQAKMQDDIEYKVCVTAQHREMLDQVLDLYDIKPDYDLDIMSKKQDLFDVTTSVISGLKDILIKEAPDLVLVQGDTTTTMAASLAAFYLKIKIAHVEAGLRTENKYSPFPEEINRRIASCLADFHFCPTELSKKNLLKEGISENDIFVTGNTIIDALLIAKGKVLVEEDNYRKHFSFLENDKKIILITGHRRENFGKGFQNICESIKALAERYMDIVQFVYPVHLNPNVQEPVNKISGGLQNVYLIPPQDYLRFLYLMMKSFIILTDSGGIQEEAPSFGKPVLVMRDTTERPEAVSAGSAKLVGTDKKTIEMGISALLEDVNDYQRMSRCYNPFGDGKSARRILNIIKRIY